MRDVGDLLGPWRMAIVAAGAHAGPPDDAAFDLAATVPGTAFGALGSIRLSFACSEAEIEKAMARMQKAFASLA